MSFVVTPTLAVAGLTAAYGALTVASPAGLYKTMYTKKEQSKAGRTAARWGGLFLITGGALGIAANHMARAKDEDAKKLLNLLTAAQLAVYAAVYERETFVGTMHNDDEVDGALLGPALGHASAAMSVGLSAWALAEALSKKAKPAL